LWLVELVAKLKEFLWLENIAKEIGIAANRSGQWRYRMGDYRVICEIIDEEVVVLALTLGRRKDI
jgi:mRNA-degrading endonuclease RelE of RelBE toxin-antitoxin system